MIFPIVFYHGKEPYDSIRDLRDLIQAPKKVVEKILFKEFLLVDNHTIKDDELREQHWLGTMMFFMKHVYDREVGSLIQPLTEILEKIQFEIGGDILIINLLDYWVEKAETEMEPQEFIDIVQERLTISIKGATYDHGRQTEAAGHATRITEEGNIMSDLSQKKCKACEGGVAPLQKPQVKDLLQQIPEWRVGKLSFDEEGLGTPTSIDCIYRDFKFKNYYQTMAFVNAVAWLSHQENHHPDMTVGYNHCRVQYSTHAIKGLSENDFICAAKIDGLFN